MARSSVRISAEIRASDVTVQMRDYLWPTPNEADVQIEAEPTVALRVSPRPAFAEARHEVNPVSGRFSSLGDLIFHPPGIPLHARGSGGRIKVVTCSISRQRFRALTRIADEGWDSRRLQACLDVCGTPIDGTLLRLAREVAAPGFASGILVEGLGAALMVELSRFFDLSRRVLSARPVGWRPGSCAGLRTIWRRRPATPRRFPSWRGCAG